MGRFSYFPYIAVVILIEYLLILALIHHIHMKTLHLKFKNLHHEVSIFEKSSGGLFSDVGICIIRIICACYYIFYIASLSILGNRDIYCFFTNWNAFSICIYFTISATLSCLNLFIHKYHYNLNDFTIVEYVSWFQSKFYVVLVPTAWFITTVNFVLLSREVNFWNFSGHLVTSIVLTIELALNNIPVTWFDMTYSLSWKLLYMIFAWILITLHFRRNWPYDFLETSTPYCFFWYNLLFLLDGVYYTVFYYVIRFKFNTYLKYYHNDNNTYDDDNNKRLLSTQYDEALLSEQDSIP